MTNTVEAAAGGVEMRSLLTRFYGLESFMRFLEEMFLKKLKGIVISAFDRKRNVEVTFQTRLIVKHRETF